MKSNKLNKVNEALKKVIKEEISKIKKESFFPQEQPLSPEMLKVIKQIDSGVGPMGLGEENIIKAKKLGLIKRDTNGNTYVTKKGKAALGGQSPIKKEAFSSTEEEGTAEEPDFEQAGPQEEDYFIEGTYDGYNAGTVNGKFLGEFDDREEAEEAIREDMEKNQWFPSVWFIDDHGGHQLIQVNERCQADKQTNKQTNKQTKVIKEDRRDYYLHFDSDLPRGTKVDKKTRTLLIPLENEDGEETVESFPYKMEVCGTCNGEGSTVNPSIDAHGMSAEEWADWDDEEREGYFRGDYDITCPECSGEKVVAELDWERIETEAETNPEMKKKADNLRNFLTDMSQSRSEEMYLKRMGY